jgi:hypothetical protein
MRSIVLSLLIPCGLLSQDCRIPFNFTVASNLITPAEGSQQQFNNKQTACVNWQMNVFVSGVSALSIQFESATDSGVAPNVFGVFGGTLLSGNNPSTTTTQSTSTFTGMYPWVRINPTSATGSGTVTGVVYGFKATSSSINPVFGGGGLPYLGVALANLSDPNSLSWSWINQSTSTAVPLPKAISIFKTTDAATQLSVYHAAIPVAGSYTCTMGIQGNISGANFSSYGITIDDGTKIESGRMREDGLTFDGIPWTNFNTAGGAFFTTSEVFRPPRILFLRIQEDTGSASRIYSWSGDGLHYFTFFREATGTFLTPVNCGVFLLNNTGAACNPVTQASCVSQHAVLVHASITNP